MPRYTTKLPIADISPVYTGPQTGSGLESGLRPRNGGGLGDLDHDLDQLRLHGAESGNGSRKVVLCKRGYSCPVAQQGSAPIRNKGDMATNPLL